MLNVLLRRLAASPLGAAAIVSAMLGGGPAGGRHLRVGLRREGWPLSAAGFRQLMANLVDAGLVRRVRRTAGPGRPGGTWRYALGVAVTPGTGGRRVDAGDASSLPLATPAEYLRGRRGAARAGATRDESTEREP
ncbi:MAG TPA: hypothetical protein VF170_00390 [Planctomycetaceae bacterium]